MSSDSYIYRYSVLTGEPLLAQLKSRVTLSETVRRYVRVSTYDSANHSDNFKKKII